MAKQQVNDISFTETHNIPGLLRKRVWLRNFVDALNAAYKQHRTGVTFTAEPGSKYIKIVETYGGNGRSVYCFLDYKGNIYKSASWKAPAKHIRGTVFDTNYSIGVSLNPFGAAYLK